MKAEWEGKVMGKFVVLVSDGDGFEKVSNHMFEGGFFPSLAEAKVFAREVAQDYDNAGFEVDVLVTEVA